MKCLGLVPLLLNKNKEVDYKLMEILFNKNAHLDGLILFAPIMEGNTFSSKEKKEIYIRLKELTNLKLMFEISSSLIDEEIELIKAANVDSVILTLYKEKKLSQKGHELYILNKMKKLNIPFYIHHELDMNGCFLSYQTIIRLKRILPAFKGIYEENNDYNFLRKLSKVSDFEIYTSLINDLRKPNDFKVDGIISDLLFSFYSDIKEYYIELDNHFINPILKDYLEFVESIVDEYPRSMAIKFILSRGSKTKLYSRLPYYTLNKEEEEKLNYLF